jgi:hypothetical protein
MQTHTTRKLGKRAALEAQQRDGTAEPQQDNDTMVDIMDSDSPLVTQENGAEDVMDADDNLNANATSLNGNDAAAVAADEVPPALPPSSDTASLQDGDVQSHPPPSEHRDELQNNHHIHRPMRKRVLPARQRRGGGPGVGSCGVDQLILDTEKRTSRFLVFPPYHRGGAFDLVLSHF